MPSEYEIRKYLNQLDMKRWQFQEEMKINPTEKYLQQQRINELRSSGALF